VTNCSLDTDAAGGTQPLCEGHREFAATTAQQCGGGANQCHCAGLQTVVAVHTMAPHHLLLLSLAVLTTSVWEAAGQDRKIREYASRCKGTTVSRYRVSPGGELSYLAPLGSENISAPYFKQCFFQGGGFPPRQSNTTPPSSKTEITNILFYISNFASIIKFKM